jgi:predicted DNA-binding transcriptional regulator AlpA
MTSLLRFGNLQERRIADSWAQLKRLIDRHGFPTGRMLGPNTRAWTDEEVEVWLANRPTANSTPLKGAARVLRERRLAADSDEAE